MRIVLVTYPYFFEPSFHLIRELARDVDVHVVMEVGPQSWRSSGFDVPDQNLPAGLMSGDQALRDHVPPAVRSYWAGARSFTLVVHRHRRTADVRTAKLTWAVVRHIRRLRPDLIQFDSVSPRLALGLPLLRGIPIVVGEHEPEPRPEERHRLSGGVRAVVLQSASHFLLYNSAAARLWAVRYRVPLERITTIRLAPYDVLRDWSGDSVSADPSTVLLFGRLSSYKGIDVLFDAARQVADTIHGLRVVVAGERVPGFEPPRIPPLANGGRVNVVSRHISGSELGRLFGTAAVVVCPYTGAAQSGVVMTAYAFGRPVIASSVGGLPEYVFAGETGLLVPPADATALAQALKDILTDTQMRDRLSDRASSMAKGRLTWTSTARRLIAVYEGVLADPRGGRHG